MVTSPIQLAVASCPESLIKIREKVRDTAKKAGLDEELTGQLVLAVDETCSNIIRHGYDNAPDQQIKITILLSADRFETRITDTGPAFDLCAAEERDPDEIRPGGLGIYIIRQVMDEVNYETKESGCNITTLIKKI